MSNLWRYIIVALCMAVTSSRVIDFPGNRNDFHDNLNSGVKVEKVLTPPSNNGLNIDSNGFPGNSNENKNIFPCNELCSESEGEACCELPSMLGDVFASLFNENAKSSGFKIIPFDKEDLISLEGSDLCKTMCEYGEARPPCRCE